MASPAAAPNPQVEAVLVRTIKVVLALVVLTPLIVMTRVLPPEWLPEVEWLLPNAFFPFVVGKALYVRFLTLVAVGLWLVVFLRNPSYRAPRSAILIAFAVYLLVTLVSSLLGVSPQRSIWSYYERMQGFVSLAHWLAFLWVLVSVYRTRADWRALLNACLTAAVVVAVLGVGQNSGLRLTPFLQDVDRLDITLGNATYVGSYMLVSALVAVAFLAHSLLGGGDEAPAQPDRATRTRSGRRGRMRRRASRAEPRQPLSQPVWLAAWLAAVAISLLLMLATGSKLAYALLLVVLVAFGGSYYFSMAQRESWWRAFWIIGIALFLCVMVLSGTRGAVVGLAGAVAAFAVVYALIGRLNWVRLAAACFAVGALLLGVLLFAARSTPPVEALASSSPMVNRLLRIGLEDTSVKGRIASQSTGLQSVADRPVFGWGPENYSVAYDRHISVETSTTVRESFDQAHNKLLEELVTRGVVGLLAYLAIWSFVFVAVLRRARRQAAREQVYTLLIGAALLGYFVQNLFLFDTPGTVVWFMLLLGYAAYLETTRDPVVTGAPSQRAKPPETPALLARLSGIFQSEVVYRWASAAVALVVIVAIYLLVARPFHSAVLVVEALDPGNPFTWGERLDKFERSFATFPSTANQPRIAMFNDIARKFGSLPMEDVVRTLRVVEEAKQQAIRGEPEGWRARVAAASVYHLAAQLDARYLEKARELIEEARDLSPGRKETMRAEVIQYLNEGDPDGAEAALDRYVAQHEVAERYFADLMNAIERKTVRAEAVQYLEECDMEGAEAALDRYVAQDEAAERHFADLRNAIEARRDQRETVRTEAVQYLDKGDLEGAKVALDQYVAQYACAERHFADIRQTIEEQRSQ